MANNIFIELLPPWVETGIQPAFYDKESGTVLQQTSRMYAKVNEVVENVNELLTEFVSLKDYVENYFDNLDVQEEINKKLDEMAEDGTITNLIKSYVDPIYEEYETIINARIDDQDNIIDTRLTQQDDRLTEQDTKIDALESGSPLGATSTSDMTDTERIYVNTTDGYWYYYDGENWTQGGIYQASVDPSDLSEKINKVQKNIFTTTSGASNKKINSTGNLSDSPNHFTTDYIEVKAGTTITLASPMSSVALYALTDKALIADSYQNNASDPGLMGTDISITNNCYIRISVKNNFIKEAMVLVNAETTNYVDTRYFVESSINTSDTINKNVDLYLMKKYGSTGTPVSLTFTDGYMKNGHYADATASNVFAYASVNVLKGEIYRIKGHAYKNGALYILTTAMDDPNTITFPLYPNANVPDTECDEIIEIPFNGILYINKYSNNTVTCEKVENLKIKTQYIEYPESVDILYGKKWAVLGDSFTHGDFTNAPEDNYHITSGKYTGEYKVYPYIIGNRLNMDIVQMSANGMSLAQYGTATNVMSKDSGVYTQIPADVDYITIKIGINDYTHEVPIGDIDDTSNTTFCGAWNKILPYIIENYPNAKIGIIITNGIGGVSHIDWANTAIMMAKKYGIAYLDEATDYQVPLLIRTNKSVDPAINELLNQKWYVSQSPLNGHPNADAHEYESTIVENFLRSL